MRVAYWLADVNIQWGGVGPYAWRLLETLLSGLDQHAIELLVLCHRENEMPCEQLIARYRSNARTCLIPSTWDRKVGLPTKIWRRFARIALPNRFHHRCEHPWYSWFASLKIDLLHVPYQAGPPLPLPCPFIITPHDVQELHFPEFFTPRQRAQRAESNWRLLEQCSAAVVSFPFVKADLQKYFSLPEDKIHVCPLPFQMIRFAMPTPQERMLLEKKYAPWPGFLLYPAQTWQHKNHLSLISAIQHIKNQTGRKVNLVCTGGKNPQFFPVIEETLARCGVVEQIHFTDIVPEQELHWLYKNCSAVVLPTLYEAGCFPLVEAMFLQVPVICSSVTHLPDTIQDGRFVFDPLDVPQLARLILRCLDDAEFRHDNLANSQKRTEQLQLVDPFPYILRAWRAVVQPMPPLPASGEPLS